MGLVSISDKISYRTISQSLEVMRVSVSYGIWWTFLWHCWWAICLISKWCEHFTRSLTGLIFCGDKTSYRILGWALLIFNLSGDAIWPYIRYFGEHYLACQCLTAPSHYLNQCGLIINGGLWQPPKINFTWCAPDINSYHEFKKHPCKTTYISVRGHLYNSPRCHKWCWPELFGSKLFRRESAPLSIHLDYTVH